VWFTADQVKFNGNGTVQAADMAVVGRIEPNGNIATFTVGPSNVDWNTAGPITAGPDGYLWLLWADGNGSDSLGRVDTTTQKIKSSHIAGIEGFASMVMGPDGNLWFIGFGAGPQTFIGRIQVDPTGTPGPMQKFGIESAPQSSYIGLAAGPDGTIWTVWTSKQNSATALRVQRMTTDGGIKDTYTLHDVTASQGNGNAIAAGPDGTMWVTEATKIASISTQGDINEYSIPNVVWPPVNVIVRPCGEYPTFALGGDVAVGRVTPTTIQMWVGIFASYNGNGCGLVNPNAVDRINIPMSPQQRMRPMPMGVSIGNTPVAKSGTGTAGLVVVRSGTTTPRYVLSNSHVLGSQGNPGCPGSALAGKTRTIQPGGADLPGDPGNNPTYLVGTFAQSWPMGPVSTIDAAVSRLDPSVASIDILGVGAPASTIGTAFKGEGVVKSGRTTGVTVGTVTADNMAVAIPYPNGCGTVRFTDQIAIRATTSFISLGGDSGSAVLDAATREPVGLLFAGTGIVAFANKLSNVEKLLGVVPLGAVPATAQRRPPPDPAVARLKVIQARHEDEVLALPGVQAIGIESEFGSASFVAFGPRLTPELQRTLPRDIEGVPLRFEATGGEIRPLD
jgi:streptogramin lyase